MRRESRSAFAQGRKRPQSPGSAPPHPDPLIVGAGIERPGFDDAVRRPAPSSRLPVISERPPIMRITRASSPAPMSLGGDWSLNDRETRVRRYT